MLSSPQFPASQSRSHDPPGQGCFKQLPECTEAPLRMLWAGHMSDSLLLAHTFSLKTTLLTTVERQLEPGLTNRR